MNTLFDFHGNRVNMGLSLAVTSEPLTYNSSAVLSNNYSSSVLCGGTH
jgi:hypothetical protein